MGVEVRRVLELARALGLSDAELAKRIEESPQVLSNWKRRGAIPGRKLAKVARALGPRVTVEELLTDKPHGAALGLKEEPGVYDVEILRLLRAIESPSHEDDAYVRWLLIRLLNRPS
jgi:transcriptional regulator with XRE-family HTH domain